MKSDLTGRLDMTVHRSKDYTGGYGLKWSLPGGTIYKTALQSAYHLFWLQNIQVDVISSNTLEMCVEKYKLLYLPAFYFVDESRARILIDFMTNGGKIIADAGFAMRDGNAFLHVTRPGGNLHEILGYLDLQTIVDKNLRKDVRFHDGSKLTACVTQVSFDVTTGNICGAWESDGSPAMVSHAIGDGKFMSLGFSPGISYLLCKNPRWGAFIENLVTNWAEIECPFWNKEDKNTDITYRKQIDADGREILFAFHRKEKKGRDCRWEALSVNNAQLLANHSHVKVWRNLY